MCDPVSISIALIVASSAVGAYGQIQEGKAINAQSQYEAKVADRNAKLTDNSREDAKRRGERDQMRLWRQAAQKMGEQRASFAAAGVDVDFGTPADVVGDTMLIGYEDSFITSENTKKEVQGFDIEKANYKDTATAARMKGKAAKAAGRLGAVGTILGGASKIAGGFAPGGAYAKTP